MEVQTNIYVVHSSQLVSEMLQQTSSHLQEMLQVLFGKPNKTWNIFSLIMSSDCGPCYIPGTIDLQLSELLMQLGFH